MKNITVSVDDDTYKRARIVAAEQETSVSALVRDFLGRLASGENDFVRLKRDEQELRERIQSFRGSNRLTRDELHQRKR